MKYIFFIGGAIAGALAIVATASAGALYSCKDASGRTQYVSSPDQCAGKAQTRSPKTTPKNTPKNAPSPAAAPKNNNNATAPAGRLPKISPQKQNIMDQKRAVLLFYELHSEQNMQKIINRSIDATAPADDKRLSALYKRRDENQRNIIAINQELARLGYNADADNDK